VERTGGNNRWREKVKYWRRQEDNTEGGTGLNIGEDRKKLQKERQG
jgi:hypothetical protein